MKISSSNSQKQIQNFIYKNDILGLSKSCNIHWTIDLIKKYEKQLDWNIFSDNLSIPWDFEIVSQFKDVINWRNLTKTLWGYVGFRKSSEYTTIKWIETFKEYIDWQIISEHCWNISSEIVIQFKDKWQWERLINNNGVQWTQNTYFNIKPYLSNIDPKTINNSYMTESVMKL